MNLIKLIISGILFIMVGYFFFPIAIMILHNTVGGISLTLVNDIAMNSTLMSHVTLTIIFLIPGIWFLKKGLK